MLIEINKNDTRAIRPVIRVCDDCGVKDKTQAYVLYNGRKSRGKDKDCCQKCSASRINRKKITCGEEHHHWKHGLSSHGYHRITVGGLRLYKHTHVMEEHLGRKLLSAEIVHHIDLEKTNNHISNLYLYKNREEHNAAHFQLERIGYELLGKSIWFDPTLKEYVRSHVLPLHKEMTKEMLELLLPKFNFPKKENTHTRRSRNGISRQLHISIIELDVGRRLFANECVHHINGKKDDNTLDNLCLTTKKHHRHCHFTLQKCVAALLETCEVAFDAGEYKLRT